MCSLVLLALVVFLLVIWSIVFVKSALILLPWTAGSAFLAGLIALVIGCVLGRTPGGRARLGVLGALALTFGLGYLGYKLNPPVAPPQPKGYAEFVELPGPEARDLWNMFPIHLGIWAIMSASIVGRLCHRCVSGRSFWNKGDMGEASRGTTHDRGSKEELPDL